MSSARNEVEALEQRRLVAIGSGDAQTMASILADDYVHVNSTGRIIGKEKFLQSMSGRARETTRGPLTIQVYGDAVVVFGEQNNRTEKDGSISTSSLIATQIFRRHGDGWQLALMQLTQKGME